jgi:4-amino-4-deoxy-L-arabinose transferase-like glycosyltransferase
MGLRPSRRGRLFIRTIRMFEAHWGAALVGLFLVYAAAAGISAVWKPFDNDELFTLQVARLGGIVEIWKALTVSADIHPPLHYWLEHLSLRLPGPGEFAARAPAILSFWIACLCAFLCVSRRASYLYGAIALLLPFSNHRL